MDPAHGEISRAMRNRGVEIYIPGENEGACWDSLDLKTNLHTLGVTGDCVCDLLMTVHSEIKSAIWGELFQSGAKVPSEDLRLCEIVHEISNPQT